jgi:hypothetical protein
MYVENIPNYLNTIYYLIKVPVPSQESGRSCISVLWTYILHLSMIFSIEFWNCSDSVVFFNFYFSIHGRCGMLFTIPLYILYFKKV